MKLVAIAVLGLLATVSTPMRAQTPAATQAPVSPPVRKAAPWSVTASLGWNYLTVADGLKPDYHDLRLRLGVNAPSLAHGRAGLRVLLYNKTGLQERTGGAAGSRFKSRQEIRTLALDIAPNAVLGGTIGRHSPVATTLGVNEVDGATLRWGGPRRRAQTLLFAGTRVEYWESEFESERPVVGGALRLRSAARRADSELSVIREWFEGGGRRTRVGAAGGWRPGDLDLDGRAEFDGSARLWTFARLSVTGKVGKRLTPFLQVGHRRGALFTETDAAVEGLPENAGYRGSLRDATLGANWRASENLFLDGRAGLESGARDSRDGDVGLRADRLPFEFSGRFGLGAARSTWARSARANLSVEHALGRGRLAFDASAVGYRWNRPGLSSSTRFRWMPALRLVRPLWSGMNLSLTGREIMDDRMSLRSQVSAWIQYRVTP